MCTIHLQGQTKHKQNRPKQPGIGGVEFRKQRLQAAEYLQGENPIGCPLEIRV